MMRQREQSLLLCHFPVHQEIFFPALPGISSDFISETANELSPNNQPSGSSAPLYSFGTTDHKKVLVQTSSVRIKHPVTMSVRLKRTGLMSFLSVLSHPITITSTSRGEHLELRTEGPLKILRIHEIRDVSKGQFCSQSPLPKCCRKVHHILLQGSVISIITEDIVSPRSPTHYDNHSRTDLLSAPAKSVSPGSLSPVFATDACGAGDENILSALPSATRRGGGHRRRASRWPPRVRPARRWGRPPPRPAGLGGVAAAGSGQGEVAPAAPADTAPPPGPPRPPHTCARTQRRGAPSGRAGVVASPTPRRYRGVPRARRAGGRADAAARHGCCLPAGKRVRAAPRRRPGGPVRRQRLRLPPARAALPGLGQRLGGAGLEPLRALRRRQWQRGRRALRARGRRPLRSHRHRDHGPLLRGLRRGALRQLLGHVCHRQVSAALPRPAAHGRCRRGGTPSPGAGMRDGVPAGMLPSPSAGQRAKGHSGRCRRAPAPAGKGRRLLIKSRSGGWGRETCGAAVGATGPSETAARPRML